MHSLTFIICMVSKKIALLFWDTWTLKQPKCAKNLPLIHTRITQRLLYMMFSAYEATINCLNYNGHESKKKTKKKRNISCYRQTCGLETRSRSSNSEGIGRPQSKGLTMQCMKVLALGDFEKSDFLPKSRKHFNHIPWKRTRVKDSGIFIM